jgi:hypothetical protein
MAYLIQHPNAQQFPGYPVHQNVHPHNGFQNGMPGYYPSQLKQFNDVRSFPPRIVDQTGENFGYNFNHGYNFAPPPQQQQQQPMMNDGNNQNEFYRFDPVNIPMV